MHSWATLFEGCTSYLNPPTNRLLALTVHRVSAIYFDSFMMPLPLSEWVRRWTHLIAPHSEVLDVACGAGRHMQWLSSRGHQPLGIDVSRETLQAAAAFGKVLWCDLEAAPWPLPERLFGAVLVTNYLHRPLLPELLHSLAPGGILLYETFAQGNEVFGRPRNPDYLLQPGELLRLCAGLHVVAYENGALNAPDRVVQRIAAVKPIASVSACLPFTLQPATCGAL